MEIKRYVEFIKESRKRGFEDSIIRNALIAKGWSENEINSAFNSINTKNKKQELKNQITIFLDDDLLGLLEKRAKKNMLTLPEQIEDILRRSTLNQKNKKSIYDEKLDDRLVSIFSRQKRGSKGKRKPKRKKK